MSKAWRPIHHNGFMLATALLLVPICLILIVSLVRVVTTGAGFGVQSQQKLKAFYLAEAGLNCGFHLFGLGNYTEVTHLPDGSEAEDDEEFPLRLPQGLGLERDSDGWVSWSYDPDEDPVERSFTRSGLEESYRFRIWFPDPAEPMRWRIDCEALVGNRRAFHHVAGVLEQPQQYLLFDNGDLGDLARTSQQNLTGSIHTNGNLFLSPWKTGGFPIKIDDQTAYLVPPSTDSSGNNLTELTLTDATITTGEDLIRRVDYWGRGEDGLNVTLNEVSLGTSEGDYYDSLSQDWPKPGAAGALQKFQGRVKTRDVGARQKSVPHSTVFEPGGYYDQHAGLRVGASDPATPWMSKVNTYNEAEKQKVRVTEIDITALRASPEWPANGMIYASTPIRIVNGGKLPAPLTIVSSETVYLQGDFNMKYHSPSDRAADTRRDQPAAIMTADRIYKLSEGFTDTANSQYKFPAADPQLYVHGLREDGTKFRPAVDAPKFPGDPANVIEHNVVLVDSVPTDDTAAFAFAGTPEEEKKPTSEYNSVLKVRQTIDPVSGEMEFVYPSSEDFLENLSGIRLEHSGSEIHLRNAKMVSNGPYKGRFNEEYWSAPFTSRLREGSGPTPWVQRSFYIPPSAYWHEGPENEAPGFFRSHNDMAAGLAGQPLPFALRSARRTFWAAE